MLQFLKFTGATIVGLLIFSVVGFFIVFGIATAKKDPPSIKEKSVLQLDLSAPIVERANDDPFQKLSNAFGDQTSIGLVDVLKAIKSAKEDDKIKGIYLNTPYTIAGYASLQAIRDALVDFKKSGKFIIAYSELYSEGAYYLASVADEIYLHPEGVLEFNGLNAEITFFKGAFEKLEIQPEIFRVGDFKSAVEPFMLDKMSDANRLQISSFINSIYDYYLQNVAASRNLDISDLRNISDSMLVRNVDDALDYKLITGKAYYDEVYEELKKRTGIEKEDDKDKDEDDEKVNLVNLDKYIQSLEKENESSENKIAVIFASGEIVSGDGDTDQIGSEKISKAIRKARKDDKVKAIVLRINSPGGSALASDVLWREIVLAKAQKPVIASMSDVAASGGYYMAMACDTIVAYPNTITGSIGIFGMLFNTQELMNNKLGITFDRVKTGKFADIGNPNRPITDEERTIIQNMINEGYEAFTSKAAEGRNMSIDDLKKVASGRVWTGAQAKEVGLVDVLGDFDDAVEIAAQKAKLKDYKLKYMPVEEKFIDKILKSMGNAKSGTVKQALGKYYPYVQQIERLKNWEGVQARMPYQITIE